MIHGEYLDDSERNVTHTKAIQASRCNVSAGLTKRLLRGQVRVNYRGTGFVKDCVPINGRAY
jgi:hypothetical protein